ncbi:MAG: hypothetical protein QOG55_362, partial [Acidobacteriaceae bacterium]|nr:hypothetical protein [Acidobacteriaceae bacterium]
LNLGNVESYLNYLFEEVFASPGSCRCFLIKTFFDDVSLKQCKIHKIRKIRVCLDKLKNQSDLMSG